MSATRRYRVVRCVKCDLIYPHGRKRCTSCGSTGRVGALVGAEDVFRAASLNGVGRKEIVLPRGTPVHVPSHLSLWRRVLAWGDQRVPEWAGMFRRR